MHANRSVVGSRGLGINNFFVDSFSRLLASQASDFAVLGVEHSRKLNDLFGRSLAFS